MTGPELQGYRQPVCATKTASSPIFSLSGSACSPEQIHPAWLRVKRCVDAAVLIRDGEGASVLRACD